MTETPNMKIAEATFASKHREVSTFSTELTVGMRGFYLASVVYGKGPSPHSLAGLRDSRSRFPSADAE